MNKKTIEYWQPQTDSTRRLMSDRDCVEILGKDYSKPKLREMIKQAEVYRFTGLLNSHDLASLLAAKTLLAIKEESAHV